MTVVPSKLLLWLTGVVVVPCATLIGAVPSASGVCSAVLLVLAATAGADAVMSRRRLQGVAAAAPPVVHAARGRPFEIACELARLPGAARVGIAWPAGLSAPTPVVRAGPESPNAHWEVLALERGCHRLGAVHIETPSMAGLWLVRRSIPLECEVRVYPDLRRERRGLAAVFLNRGGPGIHTRPQLGKGREFDHLREYVAGDDYGDIHWKTSARRGRPVTKTFQIERTREVYAIIDHSRLSARALKVPVSDASSDYATGGEFEVTTQLERSLESALVLGLAAEKQHDLFGLVTFADQVTRFVRSSGGRAHYNTCRNALFTLESRLVSPNYEDLFVFLRKTLTRRSLLVFLTDLSDPLHAENFTQNVRLVSRQHYVLISMIRPDAAHPLFSRADAGGIDDIYRDLAGHFIWHDLEEVGRVLSQHGAHLCLPGSAELTAETVTQYMSIRRRQLL